METLALNKKSENEYVTYVYKKSVFILFKKKRTCL